LTNEGDGNRKEEKDGDNEYSQATRRASEVMSKANGQQGQVYG